MRQFLNSRSARQAPCTKRVGTAQSDRVGLVRYFGLARCFGLARHFLPRIVHQTKNTIRAAIAKASR